MLIYQSDQLSFSHCLSFPYYVSKVSAGFPSPAEDYIETSLDLNALCISHPAATFFAYANNDAMIDAGIKTNDLLIIDRALTAQHGDIVVAEWGGEFIVRYFYTRPKKRLKPANANYDVIPIDDGVVIFGVVTHTITALASR